MLIFKTKTIILLNWLNYNFYPMTNIWDKLSFTYIFSKYKEVFPCHFDQQKNEMIKNNIISCKWIFKKCMYNASLKKLKKIRNDGERCFENKKFGLPWNLFTCHPNGCFYDSCLHWQWVVGFWNLDQIPMMIIMEVGKNETCIRSNNMVINLMIMKTFFMEFQT